MQHMLTVKEAARLANVSESTIRRMVAAEEIRCIRMRGTLRIYPDFLITQSNAVNTQAYQRRIHKQFTTPKRLETR